MDKITISGDVFTGLREDFDSLLNELIEQIEHGSSGNITVKVNVSMDKSDGFINGEYKTGVKSPKITYDVNSVIQKKKRKKGTAAGNVAVVERDDGLYVENISDGQIDMLDVLVEDKKDETNQYEFLKSHIGDKLYAIKRRNQVRIRNEDGELVLSTATGKDSIFYCKPINVLYDGDELYIKEENGNTCNVIKKTEENEKVIIWTCEKER